MENDNKNNDLLIKQLEEGWNTFCDWMNARSNAGDPLPPGGIFLLQTESIFFEELSFLINNIAIALEINKKDIKIEIEQKDSKFYPLISVNSKRVIINNNTGIPLNKKIIDEYINGIIKINYDKMRKNYDIRCRSLNNRNVSLDYQEVLNGGI